jgi:poly(hydroxyalkanoate) depolymerase family esterase
VLFPEQQRQNNSNLCFNWFNSADIRRESGEALSIFQMIEAVRRKLAIEPTMVFVTGLSAGGAMANVMLATYPEVFAGGAIIAGLPYGCAQTIPEAFDRMRGHGGPGHASLTQLVRGASNHRGSWPTVSVWQGDADSTVSPSNAEAIAAQWRGLHGVDHSPATTAMANGGRRSIWRDATGRIVVEQVQIAGMGHGTPLMASGVGAYGSAGPFMLDVGISSTVEIARSWGLLDEHGEREARPATREPPAKDAPNREPAPVVNRAIFERIVPSAGPRAIIEQALRKAGLMP